MLLAPMRYKTYIWPYNPAVYAITYQRQVVSHKVPFGRYCMQDLGMDCRIIRGQGEFAGPDAYEEFKRLASVFYQDGPGLLIHPLWQISNAYFTSLKVEQEPLPDYVRYSFEFQERFDGGSEKLIDLTAPSLPAQAAAAAKPTREHTVTSGDTLWGIAKKYGTSLERLLQANPGIKHPNLIHPGDKVVIPA